MQNRVEKRTPTGSSTAAERPAASFIYRMAECKTEKKATWD